MGGPTGVDDEALLVAARVAPAAFGEFYDRRAAGVMGFLYGRTRSAHTAAELTADTFVEAWASIHRFDPARGGAMAWVTGIAGNVHRGWARRGTVRAKADGRVGVGAAVRAEDDLERVEQRVDLGALGSSLVGALDGLSPKLRDAVLLRIALDLPYPEIARRLDCSTGAVRVRVARALDGLRAELR